MDARARTEAEAVTGTKVRDARRLSGGCVGDVFALALEDGRRLVAKVGDAGSGLALEGWMLQYLKDNSSLPVPDVVSASDTLLLMTLIEGADGIDRAAQQDAGRIVAALHDIRAPAFGLERDTLIGGLHQPNGRMERWVDFFRERRLLFMGKCALDAGNLPGGLMRRIEALADRLGDFIGEPDHPSLVHGDMWTGNVLGGQGRILGFVDPAIYYADAEIELAFTTLFGTFGRSFFDAYSEHRPIAPGFFEERRDLYNLYPLLVHVRLFGGSYVGSVEGVLRRFGF